MDILENEIIRLRAPEQSDLELLYIWENDSSLWFVSNTIAPFSRLVLEQYLENSNRDIYEARQLRLMIDLKGPEMMERTIGTIDLFDFDPFHSRVGIGILIAEKADRNHGYAHHTLKLVIDYCFEILGLHQLYCSIGKTNLPSLKLFKDLGFEITGEKKLWTKIRGGWEDEFFLQKINDAK